MDRTYPLWFEEGVLGILEMIRPMLWFKQTHHGRDETWWGIKKSFWYVHIYYGERAVKFLRAVDKESKKQNMQVKEMLSVRDVKALRA